MSDLPDVLAEMLAAHIQRYGPLPDELGPDARAALGGDMDATMRLATALAEREAAA